jgi:serine/threonine protein kinase
MPKARSSLSPIGKAGFAKLAEQITKTNKPVKGKTHTPTSGGLKRLVSIIKEANLQRTHTMVGHPNYWAPEYSSQEGYGILADLWALGVCMYEMATCYFPFGSETDDTYTLLDKINNDEVEFPKFIEKAVGNGPFMDFVRQLLSKNPESRPGMDWNKERGNYTSLRNHPYLEKFDFNKFKKQTLDAPFLPSK